MTGIASHDRRELLKKLAAVGLLHSCGMLGVIQQALAENRLVINQGMISISGEVTVDSLPSRKGSAVAAGQTVQTGKGAEAIYVIGSNAFLQRESSVVNFGTGTATDFMRVVTGRILSVFGSGHKNLHVPGATIGIRGTACHIGVEPGKTYFCLCYGEVEIRFHAPAEETLQLKSLHHDKPIYLLSQNEKNFQPTEMLDHIDDELKLLEALIGRLPPFLKE